MHAGMGMYGCLSGLAVTGMPVKGRAADGSGAQSIPVI